MVIEKDVKTCLWRTILSVLQRYNISPTYCLFWQFSPAFLRNFIQAPELLSVLDKLAGGDADDALEETGEMVRVVEAEHARHLADVVALH